MHMRLRNEDTDAQKQRDEIRSATREINTLKCEMHEIKDMLKTLLDRKIMAITASQVTTSNTLEQFRQQFNNLQSDVRGLESGTISFSQITTTSSNTTTLNVREDGVIVFEGATDDANETTLTVVDPTTDRTISLPNETGTVLLKDTTENSFITGQTSISSGDIASVSDELLISDADASSFKRVTVDNLISSAGGLTSVSDSSPQLGGDLDVNGNDIVSVSNGNIKSFTKWFW